MSEGEDRIAAATAKNNATVGKRKIGTAYLTRGLNSGTLVVDALDRKVWYHERDAHGTSRPPGQAWVSTDFNMRFINDTTYQNTLCDIGYEADDSRLKILCQSISVGGNTPSEQADAANSFPSLANIIDLRVQPASGSVEFEVRPGAYYTDTGAVGLFIGGSTLSANTMSIADQIAALASGEHVVVWICIDVSTGLLDTVAGTPQTAAGTMPIPAALKIQSVIDAVSIPYPLLGLIPVYVYKTEIASADTDIYRSYDARGAFGPPPGPAGAIIASGRATLVLGTVTVMTTLISVNSLVFLTGQDTGTLVGSVRMTNPVYGTSFDILSTSLTDTGEIAWMILEI